MNDADLTTLLDTLVAQVVCLPDPYPRHVVFISATEGQSRARVRTITAETGSELREKILRQAVSIFSARHVRLDWVTDVHALSFGAYEDSLKEVKRNYSRKGLSLDPGFRQAVTEGELNGSALLYRGSRVPHCEINLHNFQVYWKRRFAKIFRPPNSSKEIYLFQTGGLFLDGDSGVLHPITPPGPDGGRRAFDVNLRENLDVLIRESAAYLAGQVKDDGMFQYGRHPCFDRTINHYNTLRHASSTYALCEAYGAQQDADVRAAIERSLTWIKRNFIKHTIGPTGAAAYLMDLGQEVKLGGNAVAILALSKFAQVTDDTTGLDLARRLGNGILRMQRADGSFCHILDAETLAEKEAFRTVYYDGEAAFALMRLYGATGEACWLDAARRAVDHFIAKEYWQYNDHWLAYCINELSQHHPDGKYVRFGIQNVRNYLDFIQNRITTFPTLLELCCATRLLVQKSAQDAALIPIVDMLDLRAFQDAMEARAQYLVNGFFFPEVAMYFRNPSSIIGSFFIRHHGFRVRIDDVEHYLSGLIAYRAYLKDRDHFSDLCRQQHSRMRDGAESLRGDAKRMRWTSSDIADLIDGATWLCPPRTNLDVDGVSAQLSSYRANDIVFVKGSEDRFGISVESLAKHDIVPRIAIVSAQGSSPVKADAVLLVPDMQAALLALARDARRSMAGPVIGVTGSAGKTSVTAMLAHCLAGVGTVASTRAGANMVHGIAWNLCCAPVDSEYCVLEMAIGQMARNGSLARPDVVLFTNIHEAHLIHHGNTATIAQKKARIFAAMPDDGVAILNRDMEEYDIVAEAAVRKNLRIVTYGWTDMCDVHPAAAEPLDQQIELDVFGERHLVPVVGAGRYAVYNSMAVVTVLSVLQSPIGTVAGRLFSFTKTYGRGQLIDFQTADGSATIMDHSYNANPASMRAALDEFFAMPCTGKRVLILGSMAELGAQSESAHTELLAFTASQSADLVYLLGDEFSVSNAQTENDSRFRSATVPELDDIVHQQIEAGDLVLFKGSNSTGLFNYLDKFRRPRV